MSTVVELLTVPFCLAAVVGPFYVYPRRRFAPWYSYAVGLIVLVLIVGAAAAQRWIEALGMTLLVLATGLATSIVAARKRRANCDRW